MVDFRLSYKNNTEYVDLFPRTSMEGIIGAEQAFKKVSLDVTIPASQDTTQTIQITTDAKMPDSIVEMYLVTTGEQAEQDYATIDQYEIQTNQMIITRLGNKPTGSIDVVLLFYETMGETASVTNAGGGEG